jgi:cytochrome b6-f complex iron-sulfur subunit
MDADTAPDLSRRRLLDVFLSGGLLAFLGAVFYPVARYLTTPEVQETSASSVVAAKVNEVAPNSGRIFRFGSKPGILVRLPSGEYRAFTAVCTHLGCTVQFRSDLELIWCPCHNGRFDLSGKNVAGPPPSPLESFAVNVRGDDVIVSRRA